MSSSRLRPTLFALATLILSFAFILMLAEGVLRMLPVSERYLSPEDITPNNPILRFKRNGTFNFSEGPLLRLANRVRTNNDGFVNDQDYDPGARTPLLAVVGDSYIHAQMLPYPDTVQGRLAARVGTAGRVYSFAASGAPLSQYLAYARYTRDTYRPDLLVIVVVGNDFDESLWEYKHGAGFHYFEHGQKGRPHLVLAPWNKTHATWLHAAGSRLGLDNLALVRYLRLNMPQAEAALMRLLQGREKDSKLQQYVGNTSSSVAPDRLRKSLQVIDDFLALLPEISGLSRDRVILVLDGMRPEIYESNALRQAQGSYFNQMRMALLRRGRALGHEVVDMQPVFLEDFAANRQHFDWPGIDGHWNSRGHALAAQEISHTKAFGAVFPGVAPLSRVSAP